MKRTLTQLAGALLLLVFAAAPAWAQYFETLGDAQGIVIADGTEMISAGTGLLGDGAGTIEITVPAGATIEQVLIYWGGRASGGDQDGDIDVDGNDVDGTLVGTAGVASVANKAFTFRADITGLGVIAPGFNSVAISGFEDPVAGGEFREDGASIVVIYSEAGEDDQQIFVRDGADLAYIGFSGASMVTEKQTITFDAADEERTATIILMAGDTAADRPERLQIWVDDVVFLNQFNFFVGGSGPQWSNREVEVPIPAGATSISVQIFSEAQEPPVLPGAPESITWNFLGFVLPLPMKDEGPGCTFTQGYWKNHPDAWPVEELTLGDETFDQEELIGILNMPPRGDKTINMAHQLIAAKLNVANDADDSEVSDTIADADQWLIAHGGVGSGQRRWDGGEPLHTTLDDFNNGLIGPGHCDDVADGRGASATAQTAAVTGITAYPNPLTDRTTIEFTLAEPTQIRAAVYDVMGRRVALLADEVLEAGTHRLPFDASALANGVYLYRVELPTGMETGRVSVLR